MSVPWDEGTLGAALLTPTRLYVTQALDAVRAGGVHALAHITGGGLTENLPRVLNDRAGGRDRPERMGLAAGLQMAGRRRAGWMRAEMLKTFNCGIGMIVVVAEAPCRRVLSASAARGG